MTTSPTSRVVAVFTRSPADPRIKARLMPILPRSATRRELALAFLDDVLDTVRGVSGAEVRVAVTPPVEGLRLDRPQIGGGDVLAQRGTASSDRQRHAIEDLAAMGFAAVVIMGSDLPDLPARVVERAFEEIERDAQAIAVGPSRDGGYYLLALRVDHGVPNLFSDIRWSTPHECDDLCAAIARAGRRAVKLDEWDDVDTPDALKDLAERLRHAPDAAPHTAAVLGRHSV